MRKNNANTPLRKYCAIIIEEEVDAYRATLSPPNPSWPVDVRIISRELRAYIFADGLTVKAIKKRCGVLDNNISSDFTDHVGMGIKTYILTHRFELAKRLLRHPELQTVLITQIALAVGYASHSAFSTTFEVWEGCSPSEYRSRVIKQNITEKTEAL